MLSESSNKLKNVDGWPKFISVRLNKLYLYLEKEKEKEKEKKKKKTITPQRIIGKYLN